MFSYSGLSFNAAASTSLGLMPSYEKSPPEDNDFDELWQTLSSSVWWPNVDMEGEAASKEELEEVKTVFVSGLPMDVRPREIYLLFRPFKGYVASCLKLVAKPGKMAQPVAFVTFETRKEAQAAIDELQGIHFDPSHAQTLRLELAKSNSRKGSKKSSHHHHHHHHHPHPHSHQHQHPAPPAAGGKPANQGSPYVPYPPGQAAPVVSGFGFLNLANNPWAPPQPSAPVPVPVPPYVDMASFGAIQEGPIHPTAGLPTPPPHPQLIQGFYPGLAPLASNDPSSYLVSLPHPQSLPPPPPQQYVCMGTIQWPPGQMVPMTTTLPDYNITGSQIF